MGSTTRSARKLRRKQAAALYVVQRHPFGAPGYERLLSRLRAVLARSPRGDRRVEAPANGADA
jgi:hypothetical protein